MIEPQRIAVFRGLYLGDLLLAVPAFRALRRRFTSAEITYIGLPWGADFATRFHSYIDRFLPFPGYPGIDEVPVDPHRTDAFLAEARAYRYDLAIQMHGSGRTSNPFVLDLGAGVTCGYYEGKPPEMEIVAPYPTDAPEVLRNLDLVRLLGCSQLDPSLEFPLLPEDRRQADHLLAALDRSSRPVVGLHPGAKWPSRRWPASRFAAVADGLARQFDAHIVLTGGPGEEEMTAAVAQDMHSPYLNLAGRTSLGDLAAVINRLDLLISNDTGPAHLAEAVGTPSIRLLGPTDPRRWAPLDSARHAVIRHPVPCSPCAFKECPIDHRCFGRIEPAEVLERASHVLLAGTAA